jgi:glycosyltransferase involved in cell wall biosynthesis
MPPELSLIVCFRNEAANLPALFRALNNQTFKAFELILVDDFSEDESMATAKNELKQSTFPVLYIDLKQHLGEEFKNISNKKRAITLAIAESRTNTILLTDADCTMESKWIESMLTEFRKQQLALAFGPVRFSKGDSLFTRFQEIDFIAMMACTKLTIQHEIPMLGNAANMLFDKLTFLKLNGYSNNIQFPSGDDIFLLQQFIASSKSVGFIESADTIITTHPETSLSGFIQQRIRWAGKSTSYKNNTVKLALLGIYSFNLYILLLLPLTFLSIVPAWLFPITFAFKTIIDSMIIYPTITFFNRRKLIWGMPIFECMHILYVVSIGFLSLKKSYIWKGRQIKQ